jgi:hypothetical protein
MPPLSRGRTCGLLLLLATCDPHPAIDFTGKTCKAQGDCPQGYLCHTGACALADGGIGDGGADAGSGCPTCACTQVCFAATGTCGTPRPIPAARYDATVVTGPDGLIYVAGGNGGGFVLQDFWTYDPQRNDWVALEGLPTAVAGAAGAFAEDGRFWLVGGYVFAGTNQKHIAGVQVYDPASVASGGVGWSEGPALTGPRAFAGLARVPATSKLMVFGGEDSSGVLDSIETHPVGDGGWRVSALTLSQPREKFGYVSGAGFIFAAGGYDGHSPFALGDIDAFHDAGFALWSRALASPRPAPAAAFDSNAGQLYVVGGAYDVPATDLIARAEVCNVDGSPCVLLPGTMSVPRFDLGAAVGGNILFAFGGLNEKDGGGHAILDSVEAYALDSGCNRWVGSGP